MKIHKKVGMALFNDKAAPSDVYVYTIELIKGNGVREFLSGDVTLVR